MCEILSGFKGDFEEWKGSNNFKLKRIKNKLFWIYLEMMDKRLIFNV